METLIKKLETCIRVIDKAVKQNIEVPEFLKLEIITLAGDLEHKTRAVSIIAPLVRTDLLLKFANHLKQGTLVKKFSFSDISYELEYPILFPEDWTYNTRKDGKLSIKLKNTKSNIYRWDRDRVFFGLSEKQYKHIFYSYNQSPAEYGGYRIDGRTGRERFANHIIKFCQHINSKS